MSTEIALVIPLLRELSSELGFDLLLEPEYGHAGRIRTKNGKILYFHSTHFDINSLGASEIATDKSYAAFFMQELGYPTPEGKSFFSDAWCKKIGAERNTEAAVQYARVLGYPILVKPNSRSQGQGVEKVFTDEELQRALTYIFKESGDKVALIQRIVEGHDYRIVILDDEVLCAYRRVPLSIVGNGESTVHELLQNKQVEFVGRGRDTTISMNDPRIYRKLFRQGMDFESIVQDGVYVKLLDNANLSSGGEAEDVTEVLHMDYKKMAVKLSRDMGLTFCGIDLMTTHPIHEKLQDYTIIEINAAPGLDYYAEGGEVQKKTVKELYKRMLTFMLNI